MPTVLDIMGQEVPAHVEGHSLLPMVKDTTIKGRKFVISTHPFSNPGDVIAVVGDFCRETPSVGVAMSPCFIEAGLVGGDQGISKLELGALPVAALGKIGPSGRAR